MQSRINLEEIRISYLFNIQNPITESDLEFRLIDKKYKINKDRVITRPPLQATILNFARKGNVDVIYEKEKPPTFIGIVGKNKDSVIQEFETLKFILEDIDPLLLEESTGIETVITFKVFDKHIKPNPYLMNFASSEVKKFNDKLSRKYTIDNLTLRSTYDDESTTIHISPLYRDPRFFYIQTFLRSTNLEKIFQFIEEQETYITNILQMLSENE